MKDTIFLNQQTLSSDIMKVVKIPSGGILNYLVTNISLSHGPTISITIVHEHQA
jgi:uncharacterized membrane protein YbjE (DUF340 family)